MSVDRFRIAKELQTTSNRGQPLNFVLKGSIPSTKADYSVEVLSIRTVFAPIVFMLAITFTPIASMS